MLLGIRARGILHQRHGHVQLAFPPGPAAQVQVHGPHDPTHPPLQVAALLEAEYSAEEVASVPLMPPQELGAALDSMC